MKHVPGHTRMSLARATFLSPGRGSSHHTPTPHSQLYFCWKAQMKIKKKKNSVLFLLNRHFCHPNLKALACLLCGGICLHLKAELKEKHPQAPFHCARHDEQTMVVNMIKVTLSGCKIHFSPFSTWFICIMLQFPGCGLLPRMSQNCSHSPGRVSKT